MRTIVERRDSYPISNKRSYLVEDIAERSIRIGDWTLWRASRGNNGTIYDYYNLYFERRGSRIWMEVGYMEGWGVEVSYYDKTDKGQREWEGIVGALKSDAKNVKIDTSAGKYLTADFTSLRQLDKFFDYLGIDLKQVEDVTIGDGYEREYKDWIVENRSAGFNHVEVDINRIDWDFGINLMTRFNSSKFQGWHISIHKPSMSKNVKWRDFFLYDFGKKLFKASGFKHEYLDEMVRSVL